MNRSTVAAIKAQALAELQRLLSPLGYRHRLQRFERRSSETVDIIHASFADHGREAAVGVAVHLGVMAPRIEKVIDDWLKTIGRRLDRRAATIGAELGHIAGTGYRSWKVTTTTLSRVADQICEETLPVARNYFRQHETLAGIGERLAMSHHSEWHQLRPGRALRLPVAYALLGEVSLAFEELSRQEASLIEHDDPLARDYPSFSDYLKSYASGPELSRHAEV